MISKPFSPELVSIQIRLPGTLHRNTHNAENLIQNFKTIKKKKVQYLPSGNPENEREVIFHILK